MTNTPPNRGPYIQTYTGKKFHPFDPKPEEICIEDIAHSLAHICRFNGHTEFFYSVAQHSLIVAHLLKDESPLTQLLGLLHDAAEAYIGDIPAPIKPEFFVCISGQFHLIKYVESNILTAICQSLFPNQRAVHAELFTGRDKIKHADLTALAWEKRDLLPVQLEWDQKLPDPPVENLFTHKTIDLLTHNAIVHTFIGRFNYLLEQIHA